MESTCHRNLCGRQRFKKMYDTSESLDNVNAVWDKPPFGLDLELNHVNVAGTEAEYQGDGRGSQKIFNAQGRSNQILNL